MDSNLELSPVPSMECPGLEPGDGFPLKCHGMPGCDPGHIHPYGLGGNRTLVQPSLQSSAFMWSYSRLSLLTL